MPMTGSPRAKARPCARPQAIRRPVNEPGPAPNAAQRVGIRGDGIGREGIPEGVRGLEGVGAKHGIRFKWQEFPGSCDWYQAHGRMCPQDAPEILRKFDAVYFGAVGNPSLVPDHVAVWGLLIDFRRLFDLYVNLRPVRLFEGLPCPLAGR